VLTCNAGLFGWFHQVALPPQKPHGRRHCEGIDIRLAYPTYALRPLNVHPPPSLSNIRPRPPKRAGCMRSRVAIASGSQRRRTSVLFSGKDFTARFRGSPCGRRASRAKLFLETEGVAMDAEGRSDFRALVGG
jgi:hypothetical protein